MKEISFMGQEISSVQMRYPSVTLQVITPTFSNVQECGDWLSLNGHEVEPADLEVSTALFYIVEEDGRVPVFFGDRVGIDESNQENVVLI